MELQFFVDEAASLYENAIFEKEPYSLRFIVETVAVTYNLSDETADEIFEIVSEMFIKLG